MAKVGRLQILTRMKAASLVEVTIAMVIITITFSIGMMVFVNVTRSSYSLERFRADVLANEIANQTISEQRFFNEEIIREPFIVDKVLSKYPGTEDVLQLECIVRLEQGRVLVTRKQLVRGEN